MTVMRMYMKVVVLPMYVLRTMLFPMLLIKIVQIYEHCSIAQWVGKNIKG